MHGRNIIIISVCVYKGNICYVRLFLLVWFSHVLVRNVVVSSKLLVTMFSSKKNFQFPSGPKYLNKVKWPCGRAKTVPSFVEKHPELNYNPDTVSVAFTLQVSVTFTSVGHGLPLAPHISSLPHSFLVRLDNLISDLHHRP